MSTNYYWRKVPPRFVELWRAQSKEEHKDRMNPLIHIGHTAAAGLYCMHCGTTFCSGGSRYVHCTPFYHDGKGNVIEERIYSAPNLGLVVEDRDKVMRSTCPICGRNRDDEKVVYAYSFSITLDEHYRRLRELQKRGKGTVDSYVYNEYDEPITVNRMLDVIDNAQYHYQNPTWWS